MPLPVMSMFFTKQPLALPIKTRWLVLRGGYQIQKQSLPNGSYKLVLLNKEGTALDKFAIKDLNQYKQIKQILNSLPNSDKREPIDDLIDQIDKKCKTMLDQKVSRPAGESSVIFFGKRMPVEGGSQTPVNLEVMKKSLMMGKSPEDALKDGIKSGQKLEVKTFSDRISMVLSGDVKSDPYQLTQFGKTKLNSDAQLKNFSTAMAKMEEDLKYILRDGLVKGSIKDYLDNTKNILKRSGLSDENINLILGKLFKESLSIYSEHKDNPYYRAYTPYSKTTLDSQVTSWAQTNGINYKSQSNFSWEQIGNLIIKPVVNWKADDAVVGEWLMKGPDNKTKWFKETQSIGRDIKTNDVQMDKIYREMVAKHGAENLGEKIADLTNIKIKETKVLRSIKVDPAKQGPQTFSERVLVGRSKENGNFIVIEPATGKMFKGKTEDEAMDAYCKGSALEAGSVISYRDSRGVVQDKTVEYSVEQRKIDVLYRLAVAAVIVGSTVATGGSSTAATIALVSGATMTAIDAGELVIKTKNGQVLKWTDYAAAGADVLLGVILPAGQMAKLGKLAKAEQAAKFLMKNELLDVKAAEELAKLKKSNPQKYIETIDSHIKNAATQKPEAFAKAVNITAAETKNPFAKGERQVEKVYVQNTDGKMTELKSIHTNLSEVEALVQYKNEIAAGKTISGQNFVLSKGGVLKAESGRPVFHIHPKAKVDPKYIGQTFTGTEINQAFKNMGISGQDIISAARGDGKVRIIAQKQGGGYVAITAEIEFTSEGKRTLKSVQVSNVVFNESPGIETKTRASHEKGLDDYMKDIDKRFGSLNTWESSLSKRKFHDVYDSKALQLKKMVAEKEYYKALMSEDKNLIAKAQINMGVWDRSLPSGHSTRSAYDTRVMEINALVEEIQLDQTKIVKAFEEKYVHNTASGKSLGAVLDSANINEKKYLEEVAIRIKEMPAVAKNQKELALSRLENMEKELNIHMNYQKQGNYAQEIKAETVKFVELVKIMRDKLNKGVN
jgi:hypothetical protein